MQFNLDALGRWTPGRAMSVGKETLAAYARATEERSAIALEGRIATPVFAIVPVWDALQEAARSVAPKEARPRVVHGDQDIQIATPIKSGMTVRSRAAAVGVHVKESGTTVVLKTETRDGDDRLLNEQYVTEFYRGISGGEGAGEVAPDHRMPAELTEAELAAEITYPLAEDITERYADASGDHNAFHLDEQVARAAGLPGIIVHGLCLMAFAGRAVLAAREIEDPAAIRRLAVRFSRPMTPGEALTTRVLEPESGAVRFDATNGADEVVLKDGLAEIADAASSS
ncbi:MAG: MaoC/PaaZ C-terminal domain-containing protein [Solirubrobacterales bacterium]